MLCSKSPKTIDLVGYSLIELRDAPHSWRAAMQVQVKHNEISSIRLIKSIYTRFLPAYTTTG